jgi:AcrR family transcriptional regulator
MSEGPVPVCHARRARANVGAMGRPKLIADEKLLEIARRIFREQGHTASTQQVAKAAGISEAALFKRFKTKDALFFAALGPGAVTLQPFLELDPAQHTPRTYLREFGALYRAHTRATLPNILAIVAHPERGYGAHMLDEVHRHNRAGEISHILVQRLRAWQEAGEISAVPVVPFAHLFMQAVHTKAFIDVLVGRDPSPAQPADMQEFVDVFWQGLRPEAAESPTASSGTRRKR